MNQIKSLADKLRENVAEKKTANEPEKVKPEPVIPVLQPPKIPDEAPKEKGPGLKPIKSKASGSENKTLAAFLEEAKSHKLIGDKRIEGKITTAEYMILTHMKHLYSVDVSVLISLLVQDFIQKNDLRNHIKKALNNLEL